MANSSLPTMSTIRLKNKKTGETEAYELVDEAARQDIEELHDAKAEKTFVDDLYTKMNEKALQTDLERVDNRITSMINEDKTSGIKVNGTTLEIRI